MCDLDNKDDPLRFWKKREGFKKGLLTDIIFGERNVKDSNAYLTTIQSEYVKRELEDRKTAGRFSGYIKGTKHIVFGDAKLKNNFESVTHETYSQKQAKLNSEVSETLSRPSQNAFSSKARKENNTSLIHHGTDTRKDLPADVAHFNEFKTTSAEAYQERKIPGENKVHPKLISDNLVLGDKQLPRSYKSVQSLSFVPHAVDVSPKSNSVTNYGKARIYGTNLPLPDILDVFATTTEKTFKPHSYSKPAIHKPRLEKTELGQHDSKAVTQCSVSKLDFKPFPATFEKQKPSIYFPGIKKSLKPQDFSTGESQTQATFKKQAGQAEIAPAGYSKIAAKEVANLDSVVIGDPSSTRSFESTVSKSYVPHNTGPIEKRNPGMKSYIFMPPDEYIANLTKDSTTHSTDYAGFSLGSAIKARGVAVNPYRCAQELSQGVISSETTHRQSFQSPVGSQKEHPVLKDHAPKNRFFPITASRPEYYESITETHFKIRE
jgi:hypothetical protein